MKLPAIAVLSLGLAACSPGAADKKAAAAVPEPAAPAAPAEVDGPVAGKWKITKTILGQTLPSEEVCYDKQTPLAATRKMREQQNVACSEQQAGREGDAFVVHQVCTMEIMDKTYTLTTDMRATGDFRTRYRVDTTARTEPELMKGMGEQTTQITAERLGDCDPK